MPTAIAPPIRIVQATTRRRTHARKKPAMKLAPIRTAIGGAGGVRSVADAEALAAAGPAMRPPASGDAAGAGAGAVADAYQLQPHQATPTAVRSIASHSTRERKGEGRAAAWVLVASVMRG